MNRTVAFVDVLGFRQMVGSLSADELGQRYRRAINYALEKYQVGGDFSKGPSLFPDMKPNDRYCHSYLFSDSIVLASHDNSAESCLKLLVFVFRLSRTLIAQGFLLRGGVSYSDMFIDEQEGIFVGQALTQAYELEALQNWAGVSISEVVIDSFPSIFDGSMPFGPYLNCIFVPYLVPMKRVPVRESRTINWRWNLIVDVGTQSILGAAEEWPEKVKLDNTLAYAKYIRDSALAYPTSPDTCPIELRAMIVAKGPPRHPYPEHGDQY